MFKSDKEITNYYNKKFREIPEELFPKVKHVFDEIFTEDKTDFLIYRIEEYGLNSWASKDRFHFTGGMYIRNCLRDGGITDSLFPDGNIDDYYVPLIEWYLGYRDRV